MDELRPCPFCGHKGQTVSSWTVFEGQPGEHKEYAVTCDNCGAAGPNDLYRDTAEEMWNLRRLMNRALAVIAELEAKIADRQRPSGN